MVTLPASTYITIPAPLRRRCGLETGDQVLLAALPDQDVLTAYSLAVVDQAIRAHGTSPHAPRSPLMTATSTSPAASQQAAVDAALLILERMGLSPEST